MLLIIHRTQSLLTNNPNPDADIYSIEVPNFIRMSTLIRIIKDKENMSDYDLSKRIFYPYQPLNEFNIHNIVPYYSGMGTVPRDHVYRPESYNELGIDPKLDEITHLSNNPHIMILISLPA